MRLINEIIFFAIGGLCIINVAYAQEKPWKLHVIDNGYSGADGVKLADINRDGLMDITTGWEEEGFTKVYLHPGFEKSKQKWPGVIVGKTPSVEDAVFVDLDNDGSFDVISSTEGRSKKIFISWGPKNLNDILDSAKWQCEELPASVRLMQWMFAMPMQVDGRNGVDIVVGSKGENANIGWFESPENPRNLHEWKWHPIQPCGWIMSLFSKDMDGDGDLDIVTSDRRGNLRGVRWVENPGPGDDIHKSWKNHAFGALNLEVMFMDLADLDGDGLEDALVTEYTNQKIICLRRLDASGLNWEEYEIDLPKISGRAKSVRVGDIDQDGKPDIVHSANTMKDKNREGILWFSRDEKSNGFSWVHHTASGPVGYKFDRIELIDLDGDGDLDVLTCEENYGENSNGLGVIWYENPLIR